MYLQKRASFNTQQRTKKSEMRHGMDNLRENQLRPTKVNEQSMTTHFQHHENVHDAHASAEKSKFYDMPFFFVKGCPNIYNTFDH
jgi:hypothetical protein